MKKNENKRFEFIDSRESELNLSSFRLSNYDQQVVNFSNELIDSFMDRIDLSKIYSYINKLDDIILNAMSREAAITAVSMMLKEMKYLDTAYNRRRYNFYTDVYNYLTRF